MPHFSHQSFCSPSSPLLSQKCGCKKKWCIVTRLSKHSLSNHILSSFSFFFSTRTPPPVCLALCTAQPHILV